MFRSFRWPKLDGWSGHCGTPNAHLSDPWRGQGIVVAAAARFEGLAQRTIDSRGLNAPVRLRLNTMADG